MKKGFTQTDYIIAIGIFLVVFALVVQFVTNFFLGLTGAVDVRIMTDQATSMINTERGFVPEMWPQDFVNSSVILFWKFDNTTSDSSQYGNNGTIAGANCSAAVAGKIDTACSFNNGDGIRVDNPGGFATTEFTVMFWMKTTDTNNRIITNKGSSMLTVFSSHPSCSNRLAAVGNDAGALLCSSADVDDGNWHHVAFAHTNSNASLYVDGTLQANIDPTADASPNGNRFTAGNDDTPQGSDAFSGMADEIIVYNYSLSENEIYSHYAYENLLSRIGIFTRAYRTYIKLNNTADYWKSGGSPENIAGEMTRLNYTKIGIIPDIASTAVYENGNPVDYEIDGDSVLFTTSLDVNEVKFFEIFFDDDSNFASQSTAQTGTDNNTEILLATGEVDIIQYRKLRILNESNYTRIKNSTQMPRDFRISVTDISTELFFEYGPLPPPSGNVVAVRRFALFQNSTGGVRKGYLTVQTW